MSHQIHTTQGIIIKLFPHGEDSIVAECVTADLGRIFLHIQGARKMNNKHRSMVFPLASIALNCVAGKQYYRCTGISEWKNVYRDITMLTQPQRKSIQTVSAMIERLIPSGIPIPEVFSAFEKYVTAVLQNMHSAQEITTLTLVVQLRILGLLGYWNSDWSDDVLHLEGKTFQYVSDNTKSVEKLIERILQETQMIEKIPS